MRRWHFFNPAHPSSSPPHSFHEETGTDRLNNQRNTSGKLTDYQGDQYPQTYFPF